MKNDTETKGSQVGNSSNTSSTEKPDPRVSSADSLRKLAKDSLEEMKHLPQKARR